MSHLQELYKKIEHQKREVLSWEEFLIFISDKPEKGMRNIFQYISDLINFYTELNEDVPQEDIRNKEFISYDMDRIFNSTFNPFFPDNIFTNRFFNIFSNLRDMKQNKVYVIQGPHGCGKSTFLNNFLYTLEKFSKITDEGKLYSVLWRINTEKLLSSTEQEQIIDIPCPNNDNPILLIPTEIRSEFLDYLLPDSRFKEMLFTSKEYEWVFEKRPCAICTSIFNNLLNNLDSVESVYNMIKAKKRVFDRQIGHGVSVYNPSDEIPYTKINTNEQIQEFLDSLFKDERVEYKYSNFSDSNNGIYTLMDIRENNYDRFKFLHGLVSDGVHRLRNIEEELESLFIVVTDDVTKTNEESSFYDRIFNINMNYILDVDTQIKVYASKFGEEVKRKFLPEVLESFAKGIISTRLKSENAVKKYWMSNTNKYVNYCDNNFDLLKIDIYGNKIPQWIDESDKKRFTHEVQNKIMREAKDEGKKGLSERDSIELFWELLNKYNDNGLITIDRVIEFLKDMGIENKLNAIKNSYDYTVLNQIKESLYRYNTDQIKNNILNYLCALNYEYGDVVYCKSTSDTFTIEEPFIIDTEKILIGSSDDSEVKDFRNRQLKRYISETLQYNEEDIIKSDQFNELYDRYIYNIKNEALKPFLNNETFRQAIKDYSSPQFDSYDENIKSNVQFLIENLKNNFGYTDEGAKWICVYIIDNKIAEKFGEKVEDNQEDETDNDFSSWLS